VIPLFFPFDVKKWSNIDLDEFQYLVQKCCHKHKNFMRLEDLILGEGIGGVLIFGFFSTWEFMIGEVFIIFFWRCGAST
jgi:hypothetical protein